MEMFKVRFFFMDSEGATLHTAIEYVEAWDYDHACTVAKGVCESMCAQEFEVVPQ